MGKSDIKNYNSIYNSLFALYIKASDKIIAKRDNGNLIRIPYERINAGDFRFDHCRTCFHYDWDKIEYFDYYEWSTDEFINFLDNELKALPEFETAAVEICRAFDIPDEKKRFLRDIGLAHFLKLLMQKVPNGLIVEENINYFIKILIDDFIISRGDNLYMWYIQIWLANFHFESETITMGDFTLRKPKVEEFSITRQRSQYIEEFDKIASRSTSVTSILEFRQKAPKPDSGIYSDGIKYEIENCIDILRLFKVGNVTTTYQSVNPISILEGGLSESLGSPFDKSWKDKVDCQHISNYEYQVKMEEEALLIKFFQKLKPILKSILPHSYFKGNYLDIAFHRYKDSLLRSEVNVNRMVSAISCLEALLSDSSSKITYKISIHVAGLLRFFGFNSTKVFEKMKMAYNIRSKLLHGSKLKDNLLEFSKNHTHEIVNYARICLLVCLQLKDKINKEKLIDKIDYAFLDDTANKQLRELIEKNIFIPIIYPCEDGDSG